MSRIDSTVPTSSVQRHAPRGAELVEKLSAGLRINRGLDDVSSVRGDARQLSELTNLLRDLDKTVATSVGKSDAVSDELAARQRHLDATIRTIDKVASAETYGDVRRLSEETRVGGFTAGSRVQPVVGDQVGGLFLSFGGGALDLAAIEEQLIIRVSGSEGGRDLSFASGTSLVDLANAVNLSSDITGVVANVSGTGVRLSSVETGSDEFVSVKLFDDGGVGTASNLGIYNLSPNDVSLADASQHVDFNSTAASNGVIDFGRDAKAPLGAGADESARYVREHLLAGSLTSPDQIAHTQPDYALQLLG